MMTRTLPLVILLASQCLGLKVLLMPMMSGSHILRHGAIGESLIQRGHESYMIKHSSIDIPDQLYNSSIHFVNYDTDDQIHFIQTRNFSEIYTTKLVKDPLSGVKALLEFFDKQCEDLLANEPLYERLARERFDFVLVDAFSSLQCFLAYPRRLGVPYGGVGMLPPTERFTASLQINYITPTLPHKTFPAKPSLVHRLRQWLMINIMNTVIEYRQNSDLLRAFLKDKPITHFSQLRDGAQMWLVDMHPILDVPRPSVPNVIPVGGLTTGPAKSLPDDLQQFADEADQGLIIVAFGTVVTHLPPEDVVKILNALNNVTERVVFAMTSPIDAYVRPGIRIMSWIPQNDLLGHPNTKLFITHCGSCSQHQAVYHAVPMLGIPYQEEQTYNAQKMFAKGFGDYLDRHNFRSEDLTKLIRTIIANKTCAATLRTASQTMRHRLVEPRDEAAYWVDHVTRYGAAHLTSYTQNLAWYEILMLDMLGVVAALATALVFIAVLLLKLGRGVVQTPFWLYHRASWKHKTQ